MPAGGFLAAAAISGVSGGIQLINGLSEEKKAKQELARLQPAFYKIQDEYIQNKNQGNILAGQGYTSAAKNYLTTETQRGLGTTISAISEGGGNPNDYSKLFDVYRRSIDETAARDSQMQVENIQRSIALNKDYAGQKSMANVLNEIQPYQNKLKELTQRRSAAKQNIAGGMDTIAGSLTSLATDMQNNGLVTAQTGAFDRMNQTPSQVPVRPTQQQMITQQFGPGWDNVNRDILDEIFG